MKTSIPNDPKQDNRCGTAFMVNLNKTELCQGLVSFNEELFIF